MVRAALAVIGLDVAIAYGVFLVVGLFVGLVSADGVMSENLTLADLLSGDPAEVALDGGTGKGVLFVLLAAATIALPYFWRRRIAPLAFVVPLLVTLAAFWPLYVQHRRQQEAVQAMGELGQGLEELAAQMSTEIGGPLANIGVAAWLLFAMVIFLSFKGITRILVRR